jgi:hypothetical protein
MATFDAYTEAGSSPAITAQPSGATRGSSWPLMSFYSSLTRSAADQIRRLWLESGRRLGPLFAIIDLGRVVQRHDPRRMQLEAARARRAHPRLRAVVVVPHAALGWRRSAAYAVANVGNGHGQPGRCAGSPS